MTADSASRRRDAAGRLAGEVDRHRAPVSELTWGADGRLTGAAVRIPDGSWLTVAPGAGEPGPWGASDLIRRGEQALTRFAALDWARVDRIPPLAEPARLPPGGGTAVLNLIARLAAEQGARVLRYDAPYPTEQLFLALLESFRWQGGNAVDPLAAFMHGALAWAPAPHDRAFEAGGVFVQRRERIEKIVAGGRAYYRAEWQGVRRRAPRVVRDAGATVRASLQVLGAVLEDHVILDAAGAVLDRPGPPADAPEVRPLASPLVSGLVAAIVAASAPPLGPFIRAAAHALAFEWGPVEGDLVDLGRDRVRLSPRLLRALGAAAGGASPEVGLAALVEAADLVGDHVRRRAQAALAAAAPDVQAAALARERSTDAGDARAIGRAVEALLAAAQLA